MKLCLPGATYSTLQGAAGADRVRGRTHILELTGFVLHLAGRSGELARDFPLDDRETFVNFHSGPRHPRHRLMQTSATQPFTGRGPPWPAVQLVQDKFHAVWSCEQLLRACPRSPRA